MSLQSTEGFSNRKRLRESADVLSYDKKTRGLELNFIGKALLSKIKMVPVAKQVHEQITYIFFNKLGFLPDSLKREIAFSKTYFDLLSVQNYFVSDLSDQIIRARKILEASYTVLSNQSIYSIN